MTKPYVLTRGKYYNADGKLMPVGSVVELNENQAEAFKDLFEPKSVVEARAKVADEAQAAAEAEAAKKASAEAKAKADAEAKTNTGGGSK